MSEVIGIALVRLKSINAQLDSLAPGARGRLRGFMAGFTIRLREQVKTNIIARFASQGPLYQAVQSEVIEDGQGITGRVFIDDVVYAAAQEYGAWIPPHEIVPRVASVLAFQAGGRTVFAKRVQFPGAYLPERSYARLALVQLRKPFEGGIREVVNGAVDDALALAAE